MDICWIAKKRGHNTIKGGAEGGVCHIPGPFSQSSMCLGEVRGWEGRLGSLMPGKMREEHLQRQADPWGLRALVWAYHEFDLITVIVALVRLLFDFCWAVYFHRYKWFGFHLGLCTPCKSQSGQTQQLTNCEMLLLLLLSNTTCCSLQSVPREQWKFLSSDNIHHPVPGKKHVWHQQKHYELPFWFQYI